VTRKLLRRPRVLLAALAVLAGTALPVAATALPAQALNCAYGDNFYQFHSDYSYNFSADVSVGGVRYLTDVPSGGTLFCQAQPELAGGVSWSEWVEKNSANCLTYDYPSGAITITPCGGRDSQFWTLEDNLGGEDWGIISNYYANDLGLPNLELYDYGYASTQDIAYCTSTVYPYWPPACDLAYGTWNQWTLFGPYR